MIQYLFIECPSPQNVKFHLFGSGTLRELKIRLFNVTPYLDWNEHLNRHDGDIKHELRLQSNIGNESIFFTSNDLMNRNFLRIGFKDGRRYDAKIRYNFKSSIRGEMECDVTEKLDLSVISCDENDPFSQIVPIDKLCDSFIDCQVTEYDESKVICKGENETYTISVWTSTSVITILGFLCVKLVKSISKPTPINPPKQQCSTGAEAISIKIIQQTILDACQGPDSKTKDGKLREKTSKGYISQFNQDPFDCVCNYTCKEFC